MSLFIIVLDNTILNVAIPTLVRDLGASTSQLQWIVDAYVLVFAGLVLTAGALGDRFGRKGALEVGLLVFGTGSVLSALSDSPTQLIATRAFMGIGGALIMPATLSILTDVFREPRERGRAIAVWAAVSGLSVALGPVIGGWLLEHFYWGSVFVVNVPVVLTALVAGRSVVPTSRDPSAPRVDPLGAILSIAGLTLLIWAIIEAPSTGWTEPEVVGAFAAALLLLGLFGAWELHSDHPMLDLHFFRDPRFTAASAAVTLTFFSLLGSLFLLTQYLQFVKGYTPLQAGVRIVPYALAVMAAAPISARVVERVGTKLVVAAGLALIAGGLALAATYQVDSSYGLIAIPMIVMGVGMGCTMAPATESIMGSLPRARAGVGSAVNDTTRQVGGALGVAVIGSLASSVYGARLADALDGRPVPPEALAAARSSVGAALEVAARAPGAAAELLAAAARGAFVDALHVGVLVAAGVALAGAVLTLAFLPVRSRSAEGVTAEEASGAPPGAAAVPPLAGEAVAP